jgi:hypothetical protein
LAQEWVRFKPVLLHPRPTAEFCVVDENRNAIPDFEVDDIEDFVVRLNRVENSVQLVNLGRGCYGSAPADPGVVHEDVEVRAEPHRDWLRIVASREFDESSGRYDLTCPNY